MSYNTLWQKMSLQYIDAIKKASGSNHFPLMYSAEFDDALVDAAHWKNPRWAGSKLTGLRINEYHGIDPFIDQKNTSSAEYLGQYIQSSSNESVWGGDISYGLNPVINRETTAIYIANTVIGGTENPKRYATLEGHSYVGVNKILVVNKEDNTVKVIDRETEPYDSFHRFITQDFPTGAKLNIKVLDESIQSDLEGDYSVRMNKGFLLSTFSYLNYVNDNCSGSGVSCQEGVTIYNSPLELFDQSDMGDTGGGSNAIDALVVIDNPRLSFRFGYKSDDNAPTQTFDTNGQGMSGYGQLANRDFSPNYSGATIGNNKFTKQYYTGSNTFPPSNIGGDGAFFSASRFIINDTLTYLNKNFDKTELHLTINKGTLDFAPGFNDERSMGTFEVDRGYGELSTFSLNDEASGFIGTNTAGQTQALGDFVGHNTPIHHILQLKGTPSFTPIGNGVSITEDHVVLLDVATDSQAVKVDHQRRTFWNGNENPRVLNYSGSAAYELSFLDKDHTLIVNVDKPTELFKGIGTLGMVLIPEYLHPTIKSNLEYYLKQGGILTKSTTFQPKR
tara:strand:+ start:7186 stop:8865 length:1680 start_codon:yes stop_codon:yes gene_type:complete